MSTGSISLDGGVSRNRPLTFVIVTGLYVLLGGLVSLSGWPADIPRLTDWYNSGISIQPNTAVAAFCSGLALLAFAWKRPRAGAVLGVLVAVTGFSALVQYFIDGDFSRLNTLLMFDRTWGRGSTLVPGLMGPPGATSWTLIGVDFVLLSGLWPRARRLVPPIALLTLTIAVLSVVGYFYGADRLYSLPSLTAVAFQTATFIAAVSTGLMAAVPERAPARWFLDTGAAGAVARRAIPLVIVAPFLAGWLRLWGERSGFYDTSFGVAVHALVLTVLFLAVLSWALRTISQHEAALRTSQQRIAATLESINDGFVMLDRELRYCFVNEEAGRLVKRQPSELLGRSVIEAFPEVAESSAIEHLQHAALKRLTVEFEAFNHVLGRWYACRAYPGAEGDIAIYFQDVTERKRAQEERASDLAGLTRLQSLSTQLVQSGDFDSLLRELLAAAADLTGTGKGNIQFLDRDTGHLRIVVHQGFSDGFLEHFATRGSPYGCELAAQRTERVICEDLTTAPAWQGSEDLRVLLADGIRAFQSTPLVSRSGKLLGMLNTHFTKPHRSSDRELRHLDLLARMSADFIERSQSEAALREADRAKDEFLAMLAHELRNPLAPIQNAVHQLRLSSAGDERVQATSEMLTRQVAHLVRLVDDLVDLSRITRGKIELIRRPIDLSGVVSHAVETVQPFFQAKNQELTVLVPKAPCHVDADFTRLAQVIGNILGNASKFSPDGGRVDLAVAQENEGEVTIRVRDQGIGIPADQLPRIFDMFMQGDSSLERSASGLGIGLTLVKTLVEMHGGTVTAHSAGKGRGSEFVIHLPTVAAPQNGDSQTRAANDGARSSRPRRVLIVDDNADGALSLAGILSLTGHETETAHDGVEAVAKAEQFRPDVVLLDIGLPKLNGYEACRRIREQPWGKDMLLVAVTGWGAETYRQRSSEAGFDTHVVKPVDSAALIELLERVH